MKKDIHGQEIIAEDETYYAVRVLGEFDEFLYKLYSKKLGLFIRKAYSKSYILNAIKP